MRVVFNSIKTVDNGSYQARFDGIDTVSGKFGDAYRLTFSIIEGEFEGCVVTGVCSKSVAPNSKFFNWVSAISGGDLKPGAEVDIDTLVGNLCTVVVEQKQNGERVYANVTSVIPHQGREDAAAEGSTGSEGPAEVEEDIPF